MAFDCRKPNVGKLISVMVQLEDLLKEVRSELQLRISFFQY